MCSLEKTGIKSVWYKINGITSGPLLYSVFSVMVFFDQSQPWICMKQTKTSARQIRQIRTCDTCAHSYIFFSTHLLPGMMYDTTKILRRCSCMWWEHNECRFSILLSVFTKEVHIIRFIPRNNKEQQQ